MEAEPAQAASSQEEANPESPPASFLIVHNVSKRHNIGTLARSAAAFGVKQEVEGCEIVGVEIDDEARPVHEHPFHGPTAFLLGNEGTGLSDSQQAACDRLVYIAQYGPGTASLNVTVAASIVLHEFAVWAGFSERSRSGAKFAVGDKPQRTSRRGVVPRSQEEILQLQKDREASQGSNTLMDGSEEGSDSGRGFFGDLL